MVVVAVPVLVGMPVGAVVGSLVVGLVHRHHPAALALSCVVACLVVVLVVVVVVAVARQAAPLIVSPRPASALEWASVASAAGCLFPMVNLLWSRWQRVSRECVVVSGVCAAVPNLPSQSPSPLALHALAGGFNCITPLPASTVHAMVHKNIHTVEKAAAAAAGAGGAVRTSVVRSPAESVKLGALLDDVDLARYGVPAAMAAAMDKSCRAAVAAGLEALKDAGLVEGAGADPLSWQLPDHLQAATGVVFASSFPAMETVVSEVERYERARALEAADTQALVDELRRRADGGPHQATPPTPLAGESLRERGRAGVGGGGGGDDGGARQGTERGGDEAAALSGYEFDRKFLLKVLVLANAQLAQIAKARGPNTQTSAACAGTAQAIALACDVIGAGRAERMVVVAADNASGDTLMPWVGSGFRALGAASTAGSAELAALPFGSGRNGMVVGAGAVALVLERAAPPILRSLGDWPVVGALARRAASLGAGRYRPLAGTKPPRVVATHVANSAFHGTALHAKHVSGELEGFLQRVERRHGIRRSHIARHGVYMSHETGTSLCAVAEVAALRDCFGDDLCSLLVANTKGLTGHPMAVSFEDAMAVHVLRTQTVPPVANLHSPDPLLGRLRFSEGGSHPVRFVLHFAAGFGSQVVFVLYSS